MVENNAEYAKVKDVASMVTMLLLSEYLGSHMQKWFNVSTSLGVALGILLSALAVVLIWGPRPIKTRKAYLLIVMSVCALIGIAGLVFHF